MTPDRDDPIIDVCLEEVLGDATPPDLTSRIMQAWAVRSGAAPAGGQGSVAPIPPMAEPPLSDSPPVEAPPVSAAAAAPVAPPLQGAAVQLPADGSRARVDGGAFRWAVVAAAACVMLAACLMGVIAWKLTHPTEPIVAGGDPVEDVAGDEKKDTPKDDTAVADAGADDSKAPKDPPAPGGAIRVVPQGGSPRKVVIAAVNGDVRRRWAAAGVEPSPPAGDYEFCRRTHVALLGRIPSLDEIDSFVEAESEEKAAELVDELLASEDFLDEYVQKWTSVWTNALIGRSGGTQPDSPISREGMQDYLRKSLAENKPYDQIVRELITATGAGAPGTEGYNGATNFLISGMDGQATLATAKTCRIFLGMHLQCAQCHDHPVNEDWKQDRFWEMTAFFRQGRAVRDDQTGVVRLVNEDFTGDLADSKFSGVEKADEAGVAYRLSNGLQMVAYPVFVDGTKLPRGGRIDQTDRRAELAELVVKSDDFSRAVVNRVWAHLLGRGFTSPVDDMGPHNPPSHPELLDYLAEEFTAHNYDLRELVQWIALSEAYSLASEPTTKNEMDDPEFAASPLFSHYYARPMQPEDVYESLVRLAGTAATDDADADVQQAKLNWLAQFTIDLENDEGGELSIFDRTYTQSLEMMNGDLMSRAVSLEEGTVLHRIVAGDMTAEEKVEHLFLASLARKPTEKEVETTGQLLEAGKDNQREVLQDIWWALLNSSEFILDH